jgi:tetratricopeptide (TPR) repeat protein
MREGFDARAVAVLKQILNLDPDRHSAYEPLAELYERMGLTAEAISALQTAADGFHKQGKKREALELLRKMATIDPSNTTSRIKVAELLRRRTARGGRVEYEQVAAELERQSDFDAAAKYAACSSRSATALAAFARNCCATQGRRGGERREARVAANAEEPRTTAARGCLPRAGPRGLLPRPTSRSSSCTSGAARRARARSCSASCR